MHYFKWCIFLNIRLVYGQETFQTDALQRKVDFLTLLKGGPCNGSSGVLFNDLLLQIGAYLNIPQDHVVFVKTGIRTQMKE